MQVTRVVRAIATISLATGLILAAGGVASAASRPPSTGSSSVVSPVRASTPDQLIGKCDQVGSAHLPKTRFLLHAGLAFGAFHRYMYKPLKNGGFAAGSSGRTKAFVKAALAGAFVVREIIEMDKFANADKTLCKIVPNIDGVKTGLSGLIDNLKAGTAADADLTSVSGTFDSLQSQAASLGAKVKDRSTKVPGV